MKAILKETIQKAVANLYPDHKDIEFSVDYAPGNIDADFASNIAMVLGKRVGKKPMEVAEQIAGDTQIKAFGPSVVQPGFLNLKMAAGHWHSELTTILKEQSRYGSSDLNKGKQARVEYVSANPTGPVHIGNARGGPYGETICRVLEATGYEVLREYLHNDVGGQVEKLGQTIWYWYKKESGEELEFPEGGYQGEYPKDIAQAAIKKFGEKLSESDLPKLVQFAIERILEENLETLKGLGIEFDEIVKESELQESGKVDAAVEDVKKLGFTKTKDGALWFVHPSLKSGDDDHDAVITKSDGHPTYFASDIAYHKEKFASKADLVIDVLGSNHHGHIPKLQALCDVFGFEPAQFRVLLYQYVRVKMGDKVVKMAKRAGNFVTAKEVLELVGKDSMIFFLLSTAVNTHMDFDLELARDTSDKNPVYKVQYAHARIQSILNKSKFQISNVKWELLKTKPELELIRELSKFPELLNEISQSFNVHKLPHYLLGLAERFHGFYEKVRVITDNESETAARLALVQGTQAVFANGLKLMNIEPLQKM